MLTLGLPATYAIAWLSFHDFGKPITVGPRLGGARSSGKSRTIRTPRM
jgi:hypothetical protein